MGFSNYLTLLNSGIIRPHIKIEMLRSSDETPYSQLGSFTKNSTTGTFSTSNFGKIPKGTGHFSSLHHQGTYNLQRANGVRRTVDLSIVNVPGTPFYIDPDLLYVHSKFQLSLGFADSSGNIEWFPSGVYVINDPVVTSNFSESTITFQGLDKFSLLNDIGGELAATYIVSNGSNVIQAIKDTLTLAGDIRIPIIDPALAGLTVPYTMTYKIGDKIGKILIDLAELYSASIYYNSIGQLVVERDVDDSLKSSLWDFTDTQFHYQGAKNSYKWSELYNSVLVIGSNINGATVSYKAQNTNLLSPTSIPNLNNFERVFPYTKDTLDTVQKCTDLANYILKRKTAVQNEVQITSIPMLHLDVDQIITLTDSKMNLTKERYLINKITIPLKIGDIMTLDVIKSKEIPFI